MARGRRSLDITKSHLERKVAVEQGYSSHQVLGGGYILQSTGHMFITNTEVLDTCSPLNPDFGASICRRVILAGSGNKSEGRARDF